MLKLDLKRRTRGIRHRAGARIILLLKESARLLPYPHGARFWAGLGSILYYLLGPERAKVKQHIELALGDTLSPQEIDRIGRQCFANMGRGFYEISQLDRIFAEYDRWIVVEGREHLEQAIAMGKGVIAVTGHIGNWELMAAAMAWLGYPLKVIARSLKDPELNALLVNLRREFGVNRILRGDLRASRDIIRTLRNNEFLGILIDQDTKVQGAWVDFFGRPAYTPVGAASLALKFGCPVITIFARRLQDGRHRIKISAPFTLSSESGRDDLQYYTQYFTGIIEAEIRQAPDQWVWMHERWKHRPPKQ